MLQKSDLSKQRDLQLAQIIWDYHYVGHEPKPVDIILGLGSYDIRVAEYCAELYKNSMAPMIIFSGYLGNWTQSVFQSTEAKIFSECAQAKGVPEEAIILEEKATNIGQNISFTHRLLDEMGKHITSIMVVTKPNTQARVYATIKKVWPAVDAVIVSPRLTLETQPTLTRSQEEIINEMVGDLQRMDLYPKLGYQIELPIPQVVWDAYHELKVRGYTTHLISEVGGQ